ncbi:hypothetical protein ACTL6P_01040 [Endozoicomonas acroporae]|uniref:hypothetical protein n=1 Tax=Endozoicomonas acroporae TaxID=1701104 RepID=UPI0011AF6987|nr:hypothetical protein [Endozoicomonas acroporae]
MILLLLKYLDDARDLVLFESTLVTNDQPVTFEQAKARARELISEEKEQDFVYLIDIKQARSRKIKPLASTETKAEVQSSESDSELILPIVPPLPPVRADEKVVQETPDTRIDTWQRKLLDLTKRKPLKKSHWQIKTLLTLILTSSKF